MKQKARSTNPQKKRQIMIEDCTITLYYKADGPSLELLFRNYLESSLTCSGNL